MVNNYKFITPDGLIFEPEAKHYLFMNGLQGLYKPLTIKDIRQEALGFKTFIFEDNPDITYLPGQYITLVDIFRGEEVRRSYSIVSSPYLNEPLAIGVKRQENGYFSRKLVDNALAGDIVYTSGTGGLFVLPENVTEYKQIYFFAAGSGITPIFSLLKSALTRYPQLKLILIYSISSKEHAPFEADLHQLSILYPDNLKIEFLYSNSKNLNKARLYPELLVHFLKQYLIKAYNDALFYICGPESYMRMCQFILLREKVPEKNLRREHFLSQGKAIPKVEPPDKDKHDVTIHYQSRIRQITVQYPQTILAAAKKNGIILPYSCEAGRCGNCVAHCSKGSVWMSYNEVLTENDLNKGLVLTCVGFPINGDVVLEIGT